MSDSVAFFSVSTFLNETCEVDNILGKKDGLGQRKSWLVMKVSV
jgi:hypothetical protein